jgi:putative transposase
MKQRETSRTVKILAIGLCVLTVYFIGFLHGKSRYVLYTAQFRVVDAESKTPIDANFTFSDRMDLWPKDDDSGGVTVTLPDGTRSVSWLGRRSSSPVRLPLYVDGYGDDVSPENWTANLLVWPGWIGSLESNPDPMKRSRKRYNEEQIIYALRQVGSGRKIAEVCREMGVAEQTYHRWKKRYAGMGVSELRRLKTLEDENSSLRRLVADLSLDKHILQEIVEKKL